MADTDSETELDLTESDIMHMLDLHSRIHRLHELASILFAFGLGIVMTLWLLTLDGLTYTHLGVMGGLSVLAGFGLRLFVSWGLRRTTRNLEGLTDG